MRYSNLHTHSTFSDGKHSLEENVLSAIEKKMISLGFSDHSFTGPDSSYCMRLEQYETYLDEIARLKEMYADQLSIYSGLELDYYSMVQGIPVCGKDLESGMLDSDSVVKDPPVFALSELNRFDYIIASVHYIVINGICYPIDHSPEQQLHCIQNSFDGDIYAMAQCYFDLLCGHVERVKPTVVGHFDVITKFSLMPEEEERYRAIACNALKRILPTCPYIEVNTGAIARGWRKEPYPAHYLLETILKEGGEVVLGSDSHHKDNLTFYFDETVALLKTIGFDHISVFNGSGFTQVPLTWDSHNIPVPK